MEQVEIHPTKPFSKNTYTKIIHCMLGLLVFLLMHGIGSANILGENVNNCQNNYATCNTQIRVSLYNSYSGRISINTGLTPRWIIISNQLRAGTSSIVVDVSATASSDYLLSGSDSGTTGVGINHYTNHTLTRLNQEKIYLLQALYNNSGEFLRSNTVNIGIDLSPPSTPVNQGPENGSTLSTPIITLQRTDSIDAGVGLYGYLVYISLNPSFVGSIPLFTNSHFISIDGEDLPRGTMFYKILAVDYLGHTSSSTTYYFHHHEPTHVILPGGSTFVPQELPLITGNLVINQERTGATAPLKRTIHPTHTASKDHSPIYIFSDKSLPEQTLVSRKYLYYYLIDNFLQHPVKNRILPKILPKNGAERELFLQQHPEIVPLTNDIIQKTIIKEYAYTKNLIWVLLCIIIMTIVYDIIRINKKTQHSGQIK